MLALKKNRVDMLSEIKWRLVFVVSASVMLVMLAAFKWSIIGLTTPFHYIPLALAVWLFFFVAGTASLSCITKYKAIGARSLIPLGVIIGSFIIVTFVPITNLWLKVNYSLYKAERNEIVSKVLSGELQPNVNHNSNLIALGNTYPIVSMGGNEIVVEEHDGDTYILFYTFRGVLDNYSGFLYVTKGGVPSKYSDLNEEDSTQIVPLEENWYYISHH